jgi:hypothetical protein
VPILKPAEGHKYNTKQYEYEKNKTLNRENKNTVAGKK